jgi:hypothetical protein
LWLEVRWTFRDCPLPITSIGWRACPLCLATDETPEHFALVCPELSDEREEWMEAWRFNSHSFAALLGAAEVAHYLSGVADLFRHVLIANPEFDAVEDEQELNLLLSLRLSSLRHMWLKRCKALEARRNAIRAEANDSMA